VQSQKGRCESRRGVVDLIERPSGFSGQFEGPWTWLRGPPQFDLRERYLPRNHQNDLPINALPLVHQ